MDKKADEGFAKLEHESLKAALIKRIQHMIFDGELKPGQRLPAERDLARLMGVSRSLVNVSILELESQGFLQIVPRQGSFVCDYRREGTMAIFAALMNYDADHIDEALFSGMLDARSLIECECARLACKTSQRDALAPIEEQLVIMRDNPIGEVFINASVEYHRQLTVASGNAIYSMLFRTMEPAVRHFTTLHYTAGTDRQKIIGLHRALLDALKSGDELQSVAAAKTLLLPGETALKTRIRSKRK